ncbi:tafazzin-like [Physella acuta]|uniref:tafazzin-like n=1 Tax=Physella acuta TaxID=109671 RepID=UPI0027DE6E3A|nr:tafazzin-like [Physella acuta]XP_059171781.1 tafazzin-like [Physella acuta]XP_059171782.1 tafazzin-like [Physella acuta]
MPPLKEGSWIIPSSTPQKLPFTWKASSRFITAAVGLYGKLWLAWLNKVRVHNKEVLHKVLDERPKGQGLLTVSNHKSCLDDPLMWGILKTRQLINWDLMRWTSAAEDICFRNPIHVLFFSLGKVFPIVRGDGVYQKGTDFSIEQLNLGKWVHFFPEGKVNVTQEAIRLKWGVGRIIAECEKPPLVVPIWHVGMDSVLPNRQPYIPQIKQKVTFLIGKPMEFTKDLEFLKSAKKSPQEIRKHITDKIQEEFKVLRSVAEKLHNEYTS